MPRLIGLDTIPTERQLVRTNGQRVCNRIYLIISKFEYRNGVAAKAVRAVMEVRTRLGDGLRVPYIRRSLRTLDSQVRGVGAEYIERQNNRAVATARLVERVTVYTALRQALIAKDIGLTLTDRLLYQSLGDITNREVQYVDHTVVAGLVLLYFGVLTRYGIGLAVVVPNVRVTRTDDYCLLVTIDLLVNERMDDTVASEGRVIGEYIFSRSRNGLLTIGLRESEERDTLGPLIFLIYSQIQDIQRVNFAACSLDGIIIRTAVVVRLAAPRLLVALTDSVPVGVGVERVGRLFELDMQVERAVAAQARVVYILVVAGCHDRLTVPMQRLAVQDTDRVVLTDLQTLHEESRDDTVAAVLGARQRIHHGRRSGIGRAVPNDTAAERYGPSRTNDRLNRQHQFVDAVLVGYRAVTVVVMCRLTDTQRIQSCTAAPTVIITGTDSYVLYVMETCLVLGQNQSPYIVTARGVVMGRVLIHTRLIDGVGLLLAVQGVLPVVRMRPIQHARLQVQLGGVLSDRDAVQRVARVLVVVLTGIDVRLAVERHALVVAQREQRVHLYQLRRRQMKTVIDLITVVTNTRERVLTALTVRHAMPRQRLLRAAQNNCRINRIDMIYS